MSNRTIITASKSTRTTYHRPYFDDISPRNVTAVVGQSAILNCRVKHPGDRTVSNLVRYRYRIKNKLIIRCESYRL